MKGMQSPASYFIVLALAGSFFASMQDQIEPAAARNCSRAVLNSCCSEPCSFKC